tara:strand:- start:2069 stop:2809 length:741 start_codon:yes stop_codon:yes gene_type:complete
MEFSGMYNMGGTGTVLLTGSANDNIPVFNENICANEKMMFSGQFANLSRELIHITFQGFGNALTFHKHDLRAYESIQLFNIPLASISIHVTATVNPTAQVSVHGMGTLVTAQDEDEYAIMLSKSHMSEALPNSPVFNTDSYTRVTQAAAATVDLVASAATNDFAIYKLTVSPVAAQVVDLFWTNAANGNIQFIGNLNFVGAGTFVYDFPDSMMRNPNRQGGKLRMTTSTAASTVVDIVGHIVLGGQ